MSRHELVSLNREEHDSSLPAPPRAPSGFADVGVSAASFTDEALLRPHASLPQAGWRRVLFRASGGRIQLGPSAEEIERQQLRTKVTAAIGRDGVRVAVLSRKGGVGKTTTALLLGHTFAVGRGDRVCALDANPDAGNLANRISREHGATVSDLLADRDRISRYSDVRSYTSQAPSRLEVVAGDDDPTVGQALGADDYRATLEVLGDYYNLLLVDTGTGVLSPAIRGVLTTADVVVVVSPTAVDRARVSYSTLEWLRHNGYEQLADRSVVAITEVHGVAERVDVDTVEAMFARAAAATVRIPWDAHLESGARTGLDDLNPATRRAYLRLAAAVAEQFVAAETQRRVDNGARTDMAARSTAEGREARSPSSNAPTAVQTPPNGPGSRRASISNG